MSRWFVQVQKILKLLRNLIHPRKKLKDFQEKPPVAAMNGTFTKLIVVVKAKDLQAKLLKRKVLAAVLNSRFNHLR